MKRIAKYLSLLLLTAAVGSAALSQEGQTPPPPVVYEGLEFPELPYPSHFVTLAPDME